MGLSFLTASGPLDEVEPVLAQPTLEVSQLVEAKVVSSVSVEDALVLEEQEP